MNEEIKEYLRQNLRIDISEEWEYYSKYYRVELTLENEVISSSTVTICSTL